MATGKGKRIFVAFCLSFVLNGLYLILFQKSNTIFKVVPTPGVLSSNS